MTINGTAYQVYNVDKVGKCFLHYIDKAVDPETTVGQ
jgi:hypothetical protein